MESCKNCKHWEKVSTYIRKRTGGNVVSHGNCQLTNGEDYEPLHPETLAFVMADRGKGGMLYCDEDFGCVQFKAGGRDALLAEIQKESM